MPAPIPVIKFHKRKYGDELLVDVVTLDTIRNSKTFAEVMRQSFYGLMLTTGGEGDVEVDGVPAVARKGMVACARPGDACCDILRCPSPTSPRSSNSTHPPILFVHSQKQKGLLRCNFANNKTVPKSDIFCRLIPWSPSEYFAFLHRQIKTSERCKKR